MQYPVTRGSIDSSRCDLASLSANDLRGFAGGALGETRGSWGFVGETVLVTRGSSSEELLESSTTAFSGSNTSFWVVFVVLLLTSSRDWQG